MAGLADTRAVAIDEQHIGSPAEGSSPSIAHATKPSDRDSGVFLSDTEVPSAPSRPSSISLTRSPSTPSPTTPDRTDSTARRLRRPAELNLGTNTALAPSRPRSELELRHDLIRNSQSQKKAALRSPTQLLKDRLNLSPTKAAHGEKVRTFTPPKPMLNGCILPGPAAQMEAFSGSSVRARIEGSGRPAWWCKFDKLVVFDGAEEAEGGEMKFNTRTSKGLTIARRRGDTETVVIPMECAHCQEMLNRTEWKYDIQVCKRGVCWDCRERCRWEMEQEKKATNGETEDGRKDANRARADSVLEDADVREEDLLAKIGIEQRPRTPIETVGSIEERLDDAVLL